MPRILKYGPLTSFLQEQTDSTIDLAFEDVEEVIGTNLPPVSRVNRVWWNDGHGGSQTRGWLDAGWSMARVDLNLGRVTFRRQSSDHAIPAAEHSDADQIEATANQVLEEDETDPVADQLQPVKMSAGQAGRLGEALALAKLISLNLPSYVSPEGAPGHDLITVIGGKAFSIEVKTRQFVKSASEITRWPVNMETKHGADFFLFVEIDLRTLTPTFRLLDGEQARSTHRGTGTSARCVPSLVKDVAQENDFSALLEVARLAKVVDVPVQ